MKNLFPKSSWRGLILLGSVGIVLVTVQLPGSDPFTQALQNAGHAGVFALLTLFMAPIIGSRFFLKPHTLIVFILVCLVFSGIVEYIQSHIGRQASWYDIVLNMAGVTIGLCLLLTLQNKLPWHLRIGTGLIGLILVAGSFAQPARWWYWTNQRDKHFPLIADFEDAWTKPFTQASQGGQIDISQAPKAWRDNNSQVIQLTQPRHAVWPGLTLKDVYPDWSHYTALYFEIFSAHVNTINLSFRIHDKHHTYEHDDRFNRHIKVQPGLNRYTFSLQEIQHAPQHRQMDMKNIRTLIWFTYRPESDQVIFLDNIRLRSQPGNNNIE